MEGIMAAAATARVESKLEKSPSKAGMLVFGVILLSGILYAGINLLSDLSGVRTASTFTYLLLAVALLTALGFEFVNGFHDTANAVATVIYTHSLEPHVAVVWSGFWNFLGVVLCTGAVAFGIISLLPVELILQVGRGAGFAMVFALLVAAIIWNLGTWYFGLPSSSSHTLIGSIIGVGIANQLMSVKTSTSGMDWAQATNIGKTLLISPVAGFVCAGLLLLTKAVIPDKRLYRAPVGGGAAAAVDPRAAGADVHRRELRARLQRRTEGHGADHADPDRHSAHGVRFEPRRDGAAVAGIRYGFQSGGRRSIPLRLTQRGDWRRARRRNRLHPHAPVQSQHHAGVAHPSRRCRQRDGPVQGAQARAGRPHAELPQRHVRGERGVAADAEVGTAGIRGG